MTSRKYMILYNAQLDYFDGADFMNPVDTTIDYSKKWTVMAAVATGIFLATIDGSIVNIALPTLQTDLQATFSTVQWVVLGYLLTIAVLLLSIGRWADMVGKKRIYTAGYLVFMAGSLACGLSTTIGILISARVFQSIGGAMMMALGTAIITENFPPEERGKALGISGLMVSLGIIAGPILGGVILGALSWHWIFFVNLPIGIIGTLLVMKYVPNIVPRIKQEFDFLGAGLLLISLTCFLLGLTIGEVRGFGDILVLGMLAGFILFLILFIITESRVKQPMIDLDLFRNGLFSVNLITGFITFIGTAGTILLMPFYLENVRGYPPQTIGFMLAVVPATVGIIAPISGMLSDKVGTRPLTVIGLAMMVIGFLSVSTLKVDTTIGGYILRFIPMGFGIGFFQSPNNNAIMSSAPRNRLGVASGLQALTRTLGQTTGIAILGAIWSGLIVDVSGGMHYADASMASPEFQVIALQRTLLIVTGAIFFGFLLSLYAWWAERGVKDIVDISQ